MKPKKLARQFALLFSGCIVAVGCHDSRPIEKTGPLKYEFSVLIDAPERRSYVTAVSQLLGENDLISVRDVATERAANMHRSSEVYLLYGASRRNAKDVLVVFITNYGDTETFVIQLYEGAIPPVREHAVLLDLLETSETYKKDGSQIISVSAPIKQS